MAVRALVFTYLYMFLFNFVLVDVSLADTTKIGVLAFRGKDACIRTWTKTADYLSEHIKNYSFEIVPLTLGEIGKAVENHSIDLVLTNPGNYIELEARYSISRIATIRKQKWGVAKNYFGAVVITRSDRIDINSLQDLKGKKFMAVRPEAFGGFQMAWRELKDAKINPFQDFQELRFSGFPQDAIALSVLNREVDAGTFRTGVLDSMAVEQKINLSDFKILNKFTDPNFPIPSSTRLYPEWPISRLKDTPELLAQSVAISLLSMPENSTAAKAGNYFGWTVPMDYQPVNELFKELKIGPYSDLGKFGVYDVLNKYRNWIVAGVFILLIILTWTIWVEFLVKRRTRDLALVNNELQQQIRERLKFEEIAQERQQQLEKISRLNTLGELATGLAHQLNQPLGTIINYAKGSIRRLETGKQNGRDQLEILKKMSSQAESAAEIIRCLRDLVKDNKSQMQNASVNLIIRDVANLIKLEAQRNKVKINLSLDDNLPEILADIVQIEQVILNLARNAIDAMHDPNCKERILTIATALEGENNVRVSILDTGFGLNTENKQNIFEPFVSDKVDGLGLGLSISRRIVEAHGGQIWVTKSGIDGTEIRFSIPLSKNDA